MFRLSITPKAESDLIGIWVYTCEEWGVDQADTHTDQLETEIKQLMNHPSLGTNYAMFSQGIVDYWLNIMLFFINYLKRKYWLFVYYTRK